MSLLLSFHSPLNRECNCLLPDLNQNIFLPPTQQTTLRTFGDHFCCLTPRTMYNHGPTHNETQRISHYFLSASIMLFYISVGTTAVFSEPACDGSNKWDFYMLSPYLYIHIDPPLPHRWDFVCQCRNGLLLLEEHT